MFKGLYIKAFQSHKKTSLSFHPGLNVIKGKGLSGKTAIWRVIRLLKDNRPLGFRYHNKSVKGSETVVGASLTDGPGITLSKTKKTAVYKIEGEEPLRKFGQKVPKEIREILNLGSLNLQGQLDPPFLVTESPPEIFRQISQITNSEQLTNWSSIASNRINEFNREAKRQKGKIRDLNKLLRKLPSKELEKVDKIISKIEKLEGKIIALTKEYDIIDDCLAQIEDLGKKIEKKGEYLKINQYLIQIDFDTQKIRELKRESVTLSNILDMRDELKGAIKRKDQLINKYARTLKDKRQCPTCFASIKAKDVERIIREMQ